MKRAYPTLFLLLLLLSSSTFACNLSELTNWSWTAVGSEWRLTFRLDVGRGVSGVTRGADDDTRTISFATYGPGTLLRFDPIDITGTVTGCTMPGFSMGPQLQAPFTCDNLLMYIDPGYYGYQPCLSTPFACVTSTAMCGNVGVESNVFNLYFDCMPDSLVVFGVEGNGGAVAGCFPNADMRLDFSTFNSSFFCPGDQTEPVNANCQGYLPNVVTYANPSCTANINYMQTPAAGALIGTVGDSMQVFLHPVGTPVSSSTCSLYVHLVDTSAPVITSCPGPQTVALNANCEANLADYATMLTTTDNCLSLVQYSQNPAIGTLVTGASTMSVSVYATDPGNLADTCTFNVTFVSSNLNGAITSSVSSTPCGGDTITLHAPAGLSTYLWSNGSTADSIRVDTAGWYWCDMSLASPCGGRDSIFVNFNPMPQPVYTPSGSTICTGSYVSYQWYRNGVILPGETNSCTSTLIPGTYTVIVVDANGCSNRNGVLTSIAAAGLENTFYVFPNPVKNKVQIAFEYPILTEGSIFLYDLRGKLIYRTNFMQMGAQHTISLEGIAAGSYLLEVKTAGFAARKKILKVE